MLQGPDHNNALRAVLLRFRLGQVAYSADIENMFHQFFVPKKDMTYMRFFWFQDNDHTKPLIEYYSCVHLQGLKGSPAISDIGRRYASRKVKPNLQEFLSELKDPSFPLTSGLLGIDKIDRIISTQFYVDDLLVGDESSKSAIEGLTEMR